MFVYFRHLIQCFFLENALICFHNRTQIFAPVMCGETGPSISIQIFPKRHNLSILRSVSNSLTFYSFICSQVVHAPIDGSLTLRTQLDSTIL